MSITSTNPNLSGYGDLLPAAVEAARALVPSAEALVAGPPIDPRDNATPWAGGAMTELVGRPDVALAVLVRDDLVEALAAAPNGGLDLGAALQPALDAAAAALGSAAGQARTLAAPDVGTVLGIVDVLVPLNAAGEPAAAVLLVEPVDASGAAAPFVGLEEAALAAPQAAHAGGAVTTRGVELLHGVDMEVSVELGRTRLSVRELLALAHGDVLELDRAAGSPADLLVNGRLLARGEVVVVDENFALRVTEIVPHPPVA